jgi:hypothetical protein
MRLIINLVHLPIKNHIFDGLGNSFQIANKWLVKFEVFLILKPSF